MVDQVVVTGDITNLALDREFDAAAARLGALALRVEVTVVPGNHDLCLPSIRRERRLPHRFASFPGSGLPQQPGVAPRRSGRPPLPACPCRDDLRRRRGRRPAGVRLDPRAARQRRSRKSPRQGRAAACRRRAPRVPARRRPACRQPDGRAARIGRERGAHRTPAARAPACTPWPSPSTAIAQRGVDEPDAGHDGTSLASRCSSSQRVVTVLWVNAGSSTRRRSSGRLVVMPSICSPASAERSRRSAWSRSVP